MVKFNVIYSEHYGAEVCHIEITCDHILTSDEGVSFMVAKPKEEFDEEVAFIPNVISVIMDGVAKELKDG